MGVRRRIAKWWEGRRIAPPQEDPRFGEMFIGLPTYERPALRRALEASLRFLRQRGGDILVALIIGVMTAVGALLWGLITH